MYALLQFHSRQTNIAFGGSSLWSTCLPWSSGRKYYITTKSHKTISASEAEKGYLKMHAAVSSSSEHCLAFFSSSSSSSPPLCCQLEYLQSLIKKGTQKRLKDTTRKFVAQFVLIPQSVEHKVGCMTIFQKLPSKLFN